MNLLLAMFHRELVRVPRMKFFHWIRASLAAFITLIFLMNLEVSQSGSKGLVIYEFFAHTSLVFLSVIGPIWSSISMFEEKEKNTLPLLFLTDLNSFQIIYAKFISRFFIQSLVFLGALPIVMLCVSLGGIAPEQIFASLLSIISFAALMTAIGIFVASALNHHRAPNIAFWIGALYLIISYVVHLQLKPPAWLSFSPFMAFLDLIQKNDSSYCLWNAMWQTAFAVLFLSTSGYFLNLSYARKISYSREAAQEKEIKKRVLQGKRIQVRGNAVAWRDYYKAYGGGTKRNIGLVVICTMISIAAYIAFVIFENKSEIGYFVGFSAIIFSAFAVFTTMYNCTRAFTREKEQKTVENLLCTAMTNEQIFWGKMIGALRGSNVLFICAFGLWVLLFFVHPKEFPLELRYFNFVVSGALLAMALFCCALYVSISCHSSIKATIVSLVVVLCWLGFDSIFRALSYFGVYGDLTYIVVYIFVIMALINSVIADLRRLILT